MLQEGHAAAPNVAEQERLYRECITGHDALRDARIGCKPSTRNRQLANTAVCPALSSLASLLMAQQQFVEAESLSRRLLDIAERNKRRDPHSVSFALRCVADAVGAQLRVEEAEVLTRRELQIYEQLGGGEDFAQHALCCQARHWQAAGNAEKARTSAEEASRIKTRHLPRGFIAETLATILGG